MGVFGVSFCLGRGEWEWVGHFFRSMRVGGREWVGVSGAGCTV